jgi:hypothetical protein
MCHQKFIFAVVGFFVPYLAFSATIGTLTFFPSRPTSDDAVTLVLTPSQGVSDNCPLGVSVQSGFVSVIALPRQCLLGGGATNTAYLGVLGAGVYTVIWNFPDNFYNDPMAATATLLVTSSPPVPAPVLSLLGNFVMAGGIILLFCTATSKHRVSQPFVQADRGDGLPVLS